MQQVGSYPVRFSVEYPERELNLATTFFRLLMAIPVLVLAGSVGGAVWEWTTEQGGSAAAAAGGVLFFGPLLMILFRRKYPRWWFDWNLELQRFGSRVVAYLALMDDHYPATDESQAVHLDYVYPDATRDL